MTNKIDQKTRAYFKETARRIISNDRMARKHGASQNTIGDITTAMIDAYVMGLKGKVYSSPPSDFIDWIEIPPRSRNTLQSMSFGLSKRLGIQSNKLWDIEKTLVGSKTKWRMVQNGKLRNERTIADGSVAPLIRMRLLEKHEGSHTLFRLTELGKKTCAEYWRRSDSDDPTLPIISLR